MTYMEGATIGKYKILSELGRGGMGVVYLAEDTVLHRQVALKLLPHRQFASEADRERFLAEARSAAAFSHPNIVHVHALEILDDSPVIEMEYIERGSLEQLSRAEVLTIHEVVRIAGGIASALEYCHAHGAVHRDIKPGNILIAKDGSAKLADFGLAKIFDALIGSVATATHSALFAGTPRYAPPEAWRGSEPDVSWDVYSLGAVLYEQIGGEAPFEGNSPLEIAHRIAGGPPKPLRQLNPRVSEPLADLVDRMLAIDPGERPSSASDVSMTLGEVPEYSDGGGLTAQTVQQPLSSVSAVSKLRPATGRARRIFGAIVFVALLAFTATIGFWSGLSDRAGVGRDVSADSGLVDEPSIGEDLRGDSRVLVALLEGELPYSSERWLSCGGDEDPGTRTFVASGDGHLALLEAQSEDVDGKRLVTGHWAAYFDGSATVLRTGVLRGHLRQSADSRTIAGVLVYDCDQDGERYSVSVAASATASSLSCSDYAREWGQQDRSATLLRGELLPRGVAWANMVEQHLLCDGDSHLEASITSSGS